jgi:hypothetical protein
MSLLRGCGERQRHERIEGVVTAVARITLEVSVRLLRP